MCRFLLRILFAGVFLVSRNLGVTQNLIANSGFEDKNICTELDMPCAPEAWKEVNYRQTFYIHNKNGGKVAIRLSNDRNMRTFLFTELLCPLTAKESYRLAFDLNLLDYPFQPFGIFLSPEDFSGSFNPDMVEPTRIFTQNLNVKDMKPKGWVAYRDTFQATGGERFLYIGYFDAHPKEKRDWMTQVYFDNMELSPVENTILCPEATKKRAELYANNRRHWEYPDSLEAKDLEAGSKPYLADEAPLEAPETMLETVEVKPDTLLVSGVCFDFNKSTLNAHYTLVTDSLTNQIVARLPEKVLIRGHTDNIGTDDFNLQLSLSRAETIRQVLIEKGMDPAKIFCEGLGEAQPVASNATDSGRAVNRRIEVVIW